MMTIGVTSNSNEVSCVAAQSPLTVGGIVVVKHGVIAYARWEIEAGLVDITREKIRLPLGSL